MSDELDYVREVCEAGPAIHASVLLGSTWREVLAVIEAAAALRPICMTGGVLDSPATIVVDDASQALVRALDAYRVAVRAHQERSDR